MPANVPHLTPVSKTPTVPSVLLAEDDTASQRFLSDALRLFGMRVDAFADGGAALEHARATCFELLILDRRMPVAGAYEVLIRLRQDKEAASTDSAAIATSAECSPAERRMLLEAGFDAVLLKPCDVPTLRRLLTPFIPTNDKTLLLDDKSALARSGDFATMIALRGLLREELARLQQELGPPEKYNLHDLDERLHRLRAACGFCGADALAAQAARLQRHLRIHDATTAMPCFRRTLVATLIALSMP